MSEEEDQSPRKLELSTTQVAASALAAVSAAFFASWAGTAGTLIGAALGSVIATVGAATYSYSLSRTREIAKRTAATVRRPVHRTDTQVLPPVEDEPEPTQERTSWWRRLDPRGARLPWGKVALASAAVMLVTMVVLTSFEGLTGRSAADTVRGEDSGGTTVGNVFRGDDDSSDRQPDERQQPTTPEESTTPTSEPSPTDEPTAEPTQEPTDEPSSTPTTTPSPTAPETGSGDTGTDPDAAAPPADEPEASPTPSS